jgi:hypothetical protein
MRDTIEIGAAPYNEDCAQVGRDDYGPRSLVETRAYKAQLTRLVLAHLDGKPMPASFGIRVKSNVHDFGSYREVAVSFDDNDGEAVDLAYWLDSNAPGHWDDEALAEQLDAQEAAE